MKPCALLKLNFQTSLVYATKTKSNALPPTVGAGGTATVSVYVTVNDNVPLYNIVTCTTYMRVFTV